MVDSSVRTPRQDRSRRSLEAIYSASVELLAAGGWEAVTVGEIERRSGVSRGTFYLRFATRDDLIAYVDERLSAELRARQNDAFAPHLANTELTAETAAAAVVQAMSQVFEEFGPVMVRSVTLDHRPSGAEALFELRRYIGALLRRGVPGVGEVAVEFAIRLCFATFVARQRELLPVGHGFAPQMPADTFRAELARALAAYLATAGRE